MAEQKKSGLEELLTEKDYLKQLDIKVVILSRSRYNSISTHRLLPDYIEIVVPKSEVDDYRSKVNNPLIEIPDEIEGLGEVRNWCLDNFQEQSIIMVDDDIDFFYCLTGENTKRINDPLEFVQILINTCVMARDAGCKVFGFSQTDIRKYKGYDPFNLCTWIGTIIGINGRKYRFRKDKFKVDIDYCLQSLLVDRIIWLDTRYYASNKKDNNTGGNSKYRDQESFEKSVETLKEKWGDTIKVSSFNNQIKIRFNFSRKQSLTIS